ncbi:hypothetical protein Q0Z83_017570 [Actinoplanes sichuanensis]|uniref:Uncharacterized protein n=1 Tax=Actinoplanes sichuanensis TaxID=512349 RepID=A0ABW4A784_9ACTN|nr:hypothetical protein [Actinoplanes sichuanensis]BEL03566.1 hypothetical protein Q0Z83_017570 [Actinoplanes sichuanensis]
MLRRILTALTVAALGAATGAWLAWRSPADLPTDEQARALVTAATSEVPAAFVERFDEIFGHPYPEDQLLGGDEYQAGFAVVTINTPPEGYAALVTRSRRGLESLGWRTADDPAGDGGFVARRDGLKVTTYGAHACTPDDVESCGSPRSSGPYPAIAFAFERTRPPLAVALTVTGWLLGLGAGWLLAMLAPDRRLWWHGLTLTAPATMMVTAFALVPGDDPVWEGYMYLLLRPLAAAGAVLLTVALVKGRRA